MCLAIPGEILSIDEIDEGQRVGRVSFGGIIKEVGLMLVPEAKVGDHVLVHAGYAIGSVNEQEAESMLDMLAELDALVRREDGRG